MKPCPARTMVALSLVFFWACERSSGGASPSLGGATTNVKVVVQEGGGDQCLAVTPILAMINLGDSLVFSFQGIPNPSGHEIEIDFLPERGIVPGSPTVAFVRGPFPYDRTNPKNPHRGRFLGKDDGKDTPTTNSSHLGYWKYQVVLRDDKGDDLKNCTPLDPGLIVKN